MNVVTIKRIQRLRSERRELYMQFAAASSALDKAEISRKLDKVCHTLRVISGSYRFI